MALLLWCLWCRVCGVRLICIERQVWGLGMIVGWYKVCFGIGCGRGSSLWVWWQSFSDVSSENEPKQGSRKIEVLVVTDPPQKIITFFSSLYQCWLNCQKIFFGGNPWPVNNVRLFTQNCILAKMSPKLYIFAFFMLQERGTPKYRFFLFPFLVTRDRVPRI